MESKARKGMVGDGFERGDEWQGGVWLSFVGFDDGGRFWLQAVCCFGVGLVLRMCYIAELIKRC